MVTQPEAADMSKFDNLGRTTQEEGSVLAQADLYRSEIIAQGKRIPVGVPCSLVKHYSNHGVWKLWGNEFTHEDYKLLFRDNKDLQTALMNVVKVHPYDDSMWVEISTGEPDSHLHLPCYLINTGSFDPKTIFDRIMHKASRQDPVARKATITADRPPLRKLRSTAAAAEAEEDEVSVTDQRPTKKIRSTAAEAEAEEDEVSVTDQRPIKKIRPTVAAPVTDAKPDEKLKSDGDAAQNKLSAEAQDVIAKLQSTDKSVKLQAVIDNVIEIEEQIEAVHGALEYYVRAGQFCADQASLILKYPDHYYHVMGEECE